MLAACTSSTPVQQQPAAAPLEVPRQAPPPVSPERSCKQLQTDAHVVVSEHNSCTADADCAMAKAACPQGLGCGAVVNKSHVEQASAALAPISERFSVQCGKCASEGVRCGTPNPVCREGRCMHEALHSECEGFEADAQALIQKHNSCAADSDCVFARDSGACPLAFACGAVVNKAQAQAFAAVAAPLSKTFYEYCDRCMVQVAHCSASTPICEAGRCSRKRAARAEAPSPEQTCKQLEESAQTLYLEHNRCQTTEDCVHAAGFTCPSELSCGMALNKAEEQDFRERLAPISSTYQDQCKCDGAPGDCVSRHVICSDGRCTHEPAMFRHPLSKP
jgi:hypothetical protein